MITMQAAELSFRLWRFHLLSCRPLMFDDSDNKRHLELKPIIGWRGPDWLLAANPNLTAWLSDTPKPNPEFAFNASGGRRGRAGIGAQISP
jgi:hypothetical protein